MPLPTVILPGYFAAASDYQELEKFLVDRGFPTVTVPLSKGDWLPTLGGRSMVPILRQLDRTVKQMLHEYGVSQINLIGHSAGGWISRIYLGEKPYTIHGDVLEDVDLWNAHPCVHTLITLGTPHVSQERWTRKNLDFVKIHYPGAFHPQVRYVCVAGKSVFGKRSFGSWLAYKSYELTIGKGDTWGDGITPVEAAHLDGAENLVLEGVWHSPRSPGKWYGSSDVLSAWIGYLC
jgi:triacylglycerol esterase/lipase EstA (alpha/beta hydrolase family)